jgi:hypothetical protein
MTFLLYDPFALRVVLLAVAATLLIVAYLVHRMSAEATPPQRLRPQAPPKPEPPPAVAGPVHVSSGTVKAVPAAPVSEIAAPVSARIEAPAPAPMQVEAGPAQASADRLTFPSLQTRSSFGWDLARAGLIILTVVVLLAGTLVALPEPVFDRLAGRLEPEPTAATTEKIALLYLGDEVRDEAFHVRGVVRNISKENVEKLDANVRLYSHDSVLMETAVARMDVEVIGTGATAQFHLVYPHYTGQVGSYSIDFKFRQGDPVPYKDLRPEAQPR